MRLSEGVTPACEDPELEVLGTPSQLRPRYLQDFHPSPASYLVGSNTVVLKRR